MKIPLYPEYGTVACLMKLLDGSSVQAFKSMWTAIWGLRGTPQSTVDWTNPDQWIGERLTGTDREMAERIWIGSGKRVNPRWTRGAQLLIGNYDLLSESDGTYRMTEEGRDFVASKANRVTRRIDVEEGLVQVLRQLSLIRSGKRADLLDDWIAYTRYNSNLKRDVVVKEYLRRRLVNLVDRGYVRRDANTYIITDEGMAYLDSIDREHPNRIVDRETALNRSVEEFNREQRELLKEYLATTTSYRFEHIIKDLLSSMGYEEVTVTSPTSDKGVDVTGISQNGITTVKEVIQVKRMTAGNVMRPVLDALRGSLHRFDAFQGTIITLSDFSKGAKEAAYEKGAAPLTLINGDKLIELLIRNGVGISRKTVNYFTVDERYFGEEENAE